MPLQIRFAGASAVHATVGSAVLAQMPVAAQEDGDEERQQCAVSCELEEETCLQERQRRVDGRPGRVGVEIGRASLGGE